MILIAAIIGCLFVYFLLVKPEVIAVLFFTLTIADINFSVAGLPLNVRAMVGIAVFARILIPDNKAEVPSFLFNDVRMVIPLLLHMVLITEIYDLLTFEYIKTSALTFIAVYTGYHFYHRRGDALILKISLLLAGLICFSDLAYTYAVYGSFPVQRIYMDLLKIPINYDKYGNIVEIINHGFYGLICGLSFVFILADYINNPKSNKYLLILLPLMFLGVLMSTSRSALLGIAGLSFFLIAAAMRHQERGQRAYFVILLIFGSLMTALVVFTSLVTLFNLDTKFIENIALRLVDEPINVLNKHLGLSYNVNALDAMEWRTEASSDALSAFLDLKFREEFFGIGYWGYVTRDLGHTNLPPHNGLLMLLIEFGIVGLSIWCYLMYYIAKKSFNLFGSLQNLLACIIFIILFSLANNAELTGSIMFLFVGAIFAQNMIGSETRREEDEDEADEVEKRDEEDEDHPAPYPGAKPALTPHRIKTTP